MDGLVSESKAIYRRARLRVHIPNHIYIRIHLTRCSWCTSEPSHNNKTPTRPHSRTKKNSPVRTFHESIQEKSTTHQKTQTCNWLRCDRFGRIASSEAILTDSCTALYRQTLVFAEPHPAVNSIIRHQHVRLQHRMDE